MQYLLMCCFDEKAWTDLPQSQRDEIMARYHEVLGNMKQSGHLLAGAKLDACAAAATVRHKNGQPVITDGPFAETKEQLGGYHLVECQDQEEAISLAKRIPTLPVGGTIEVRPVLFLE